MKKFQKILGAGLALTQLCSTNCVLGAQPNHVNAPQKISATKPTKKRSGNVRTFSTVLGYPILALLGADACLQIGCSTSSTFAKKWAECLHLQSNGAMLSDLIISLRDISALIDNKDYDGALSSCMDAHTAARVPLSSTDAIRLALCGFADYIWVSPCGFPADDPASAPAPTYKFYFLPYGCSLLTSLGIPNYLQHLINKCQPTSDSSAASLSCWLRSIQDTLFARGVPYAPGKQPWPPPHMRGKPPNV